MSRKTVLITGTSSGIGRACISYFLARNWNVVATARKPESIEEFAKHEFVKILPLDVCSADSVKNAIDEAISHFHNIDVLVNNAGYAVTGVFEDTRTSQLRQQFDVNVFGLMEVCRAILPHFRAKKSGTIINVSSIAGHCGFPSFSLYNATKFAVEGFSESLWYELNPLKIKVKLVEPGPIVTDFYTRSMDIAINKDGEYSSYMEKVVDKLNMEGAKGLPAERVAKTIYRAAASKSGKLRYPVGGAAAAIITLRHLVPNCMFRFFVKKYMGIK